MSDASGYIQFLAEARSGDRLSLSRLALLVRERLYPFVLRTTLNRDATDDILQETLLTMLRRLGSLRDTTRFWPWIYRIAWNKIRDRRRGRRLRALHETAVRQWEEAGACRQVDADPLDTQVRAEALDQVSSALDGLDHQQRDILRLRCYDGLAYGEIAALTRTTPNEARVRFHRAKRSLKACLAACGT
ncbi:MAG: RNA polymerase sigma factor [Planctomycetes bacterium]|jgi:RNA polymerase sigma-70 factor (ECF subfamily)|nr:RNA polymerase sigma factor [Planctomycetota bacterium]